MSDVLAGQVALLAGAPDAIGDAIGRAFTQAGAVVVTCLADSREAVERAAGDLMARFGQLDVLVTNASEPRLGAVDDLTDGDVERSWHAGVLGCVRAMQVAHQHLCGGGRIVNVLSTLSRGADIRGAGLVVACEEAIRTISRTAAVEWGRDGVRVNALGVPTASTDTDAVASVAAFLASPASRYITGSLMIADGGRTIIR